MLRNASEMTAQREALRKGIEYLTVLFPTEVSSFDFQIVSTGRTVQYKLNAQSLRLFGLHGDVNDAHRAGANRLQNKQTITKQNMNTYLKRICRKSWLPERLWCAWFFNHRLHSICPAIVSLSPQTVATIHTPVHQSISLLWPICTLLLVVRPNAKRHKQGSLTQVLITQTSL